MLSTVVIDVPAEVAPAMAAVAVARCEQVLGAGRCLLEADTKAPSTAQYEARVTLDGSGAPALRIAFLRVSEPDLPLAERTLVFSEADASQSRWASVGLVVAGLVTAFDEHGPPAVAPAKKRPIQSPLLIAPKPVLGFDVGLVAGPALDEGAWRAGGLVRGWYGFASNHHVLVVGGLRYLGRLEGPALHWSSLSLGLGTRLGSRQALLSAELVGELVGERVMLWASEPDTGRSDSAHQYRFGGRMGVNVALRATNLLGVVVGAEAGAMTPPVKVVVRDEIVGREPTARFGVWSGLRFSL